MQALEAAQFETWRDRAAAEKARAKMALEPSTIVQKTTFRVFRAGSCQCGFRRPFENRVSQLQDLVKFGV